MTAWIQSNLPWILIGMIAAIVLLALFLFALWVKNSKLKKKLDFFLEDNSDDDPVSLEQKIEDYANEVKAIRNKYNEIYKMTEDMNKNMQYCVQKVGVVRYNPFDEMGGNLCFSVAILDGRDDGVVFNGIHSRTGSFTYAKPIQRGVSPYTLSDEEVEAIDKARKATYQPMDMKIVIDRPVRKYKVVKPLVITEEEPEEHHFDPKTETEAFVEDILKQANRLPEKIEENQSDEDKKSVEENEDIDIEKMEDNDDGTVDDSIKENRVADENNQ